MSYFYCSKCSGTFDPAFTYCPVCEDVSLIEQLQAKVAELEAENARLKAQLATAEQRVAEACALTYLEDYDLTDIAERVRAGEWRKFVKEV